MSPDEAYQRGMADYEAAMVAHAQSSAASPEAYYYQGLADYEQALLAQAAAVEAQNGSAEATYMQGMADYEALLLQQMELEQLAALEAAAASTEHDEAHRLGMLHYEAELLAGSLAEAAKNLTDDQRSAYERGRAEYEAALAAAMGESGQQPAAPVAEAPASPRGGRRRRGKRSA